MAFLKQAAKKSLAAFVQRVGGPNLTADLLARQTSSESAWANDALFLESLPDGRVLDLDDPAAEGAGALWHALWGRAVHRPPTAAPIYRIVECRLGERTFRLCVDLTRVPECGYYLRNPTPELTRLIRPGGEGFLDIGANVGFHTLSAATTFERVLAFEPTPTTATRLRENVELASAKNVEIYAIGLSSREGTAALYTDRRHHGGNTLEQGVAAEFSQTADSMEVPVRTLDTVVEEAGVEALDLAKVDVEGHEAEVLAGGRYTLERFEPTLFVEINSGEAMRRVLDVLPASYSAWHPVSQRALSEADLLSAGRPRDVVLAVRSPYGE